MIPPNILLRAATYHDVPKDYMPKVPKYAKPLDAWTGVPYLGAIRFDMDTMKCYKYTENGWEEIKQ